MFLQIGSISGMVCIFWNHIIQIILYYKLFIKSPWGVWVSASTLPVLSGCLGYLISVICRLTHKQCTTVAYETGCQSISLATGVIVLSFPVHEAGPMQIMPMIYGLFQISDGYLTVAAFRLGKHMKGKFQTKADKNQLKHDHETKTSNDLKQEAIITQHENFAYNNSNDCLNNGCYSNQNDKRYTAMQ